MAFEITSANMLMPIPGVGLTSGPQWATDVNTCLSIIDSHDHSPNSGVPITPQGLNINSDLPFNSNNLTSIRSCRFTAQGSPIALPTDLGCVYVSGVDLYFNDVNGNQVRITQSGGVAGSPGSIANLNSPASASYVSLSTKFVWQSNTNVAADMDFRSAILRNSGASSFGLTLSPPTLAADIAITLPQLPASNALVTMDNTGAMLASTALYAALNPTGSVIGFAGSSAPTGYLICDGSAVSRSTYSALFAVIGVSCGQGDGSTTFNLPDYRGRFLRMVDGSANRDPDKASRTAMNTGGNTGNNVGSVQDDAFESHTHSTIAISQNAAGGATIGAYNGTNTVTGATGGNETRPINAYINFIIKT